MLETSTDKSRTFGKFAIDLDVQDLVCEGEPAKLPLKSFQLLLALADHRGKLLPYHVLLKLVWGEEKENHHNYKHNVQQTMRPVLQALGREHKIWLETRHGIGYRFRTEAQVRRASKEHV